MSRQTTSAAEPAALQQKKVFHVNGDKYIYSTTFTDSNGRVWEYFGHGNFNVVYRLAPLAEDTTINGVTYPHGFELIYKEPLKIDDLKSDTKANKPARAVRVLNEIWEKCYPYLPKAVEYTGGVGAPGREGSIMMFVEGRPSNANEICGEQVRIYNATGRIVVDALANNYITTWIPTTTINEIRVTISIDNTFAVKIPASTNQSQDSLDYWDVMQSKIDNYLTQYENAVQYRPICNLTKAILFLAMHFPEIKNVDVLLTQPALVGALKNAYDRNILKPHRLLCQHFSTQISFNHLIEDNPLLIDLKNNGLSEEYIRRLAKNNALLTLTEKHKEIFLVLADKISPTEVMDRILQLKPENLGTLTINELAIVVATHDFSDLNICRYRNQENRAEINNRDRDEILTLILTTNPEELRIATIFKNLLYKLNTNISLALKAMRSFFKNGGNSSADANQVLVALATQSIDHDVLNQMIDSNSRCSEDIKNLACKRLNKLAANSAAAAATSTVAVAFFQPVQSANNLLVPSATSTRDMEVQLADFCDNSKKLRVG